MVQSWRQGLEFLIVCVIASLVCAGTIGWGVEWLGFLPFAVLAPAVFINNMVMTLVLGPPLLLFLYPRVQAWGLRYQDLFLGNYTEFSEGYARVPMQVLSGKTGNIEPIGGRTTIDIHDLTFRYASGPTPVLHGLSLSVESGQSMAVMGRGGSGKSTLCFALNGLIPQFLHGEYAGTIRVNGRDTMTHPVWQLANDVGIVFQDFETQLVSTNVETELRYPLECENIPYSSGVLEMVQTRIEETLNVVGLAGLERRDPFTLSGGNFPSSSLSPAGTPVSSSIP